MLKNQPHFVSFFFFFNDTATTEIYTLSLHDALPISARQGRRLQRDMFRAQQLQRDLAREVRLLGRVDRSEEHTSELQSPCNLVCRLLLEKKKINHKLSLSTAATNDMMRTALTH